MARESDIVVPGTMSPLSPRISVSGVVPQVAGRPRPGARGLMSGALGCWATLARPRVTPATAGTLAAGSRQL